MRLSKKERARGGDVQHCDIHLSCKRAAMQGLADLIIAVEPIGALRAA